MNFAQEETARQPLEPSDTSSFRATLYSFINACNEVYDLAESTDAGSDVTTRLLPAFERIRDCLDLTAVTGDLRDTVGIESAVLLKEVLDRIELPADGEIPVSAPVDGEPVWRLAHSRHSDHHPTGRRKPAG